MIIKAPKKIKGFALAELAMVISIIALVIGAISGGVMLTKNSTIRAVIAESQYYTNAVNNFIIVYGFYPGDFPRAYNSTTASSIWGTATGCTSAACNGNGNGSILWSTETYLAWLHLQLAGIISGSYTGVGSGGGATLALIGVNVPGSKYSGTCYSMEACDSTTSGCSFVQGNIMTLGGVSSVADNTHCVEGTMAKLDAYNVDNKIDDGMPVTGMVRVRANPVGVTLVTNLCATGTATTSTYNLGVSPQLGCALVFPI